MKKRKAKKHLVAACCLAVVLLLSSWNVFADSSNGESEGGTTNKPLSCKYYYSEYGWRVSVYVAKDIGYDEKAYKETSLKENYYKMGTIDVTGFDVPGDVLCGTKNKVEYSIRPEVKLKPNNRSYYKRENCPPIPKVSYRYSVLFDDIDEVNAAFRQNTVILDLLREMAERKGFSRAFDLVKDLQFTNHYTDADGNRWYQTRTGAEWGEKRILPTNDRMNLVPWVIIYEPMAMVRLEDDTPLAFLTATEYALTQGVNYNWLWAGSESYRQGNWGGVTYPTGGLPGRAIQSLAFNALPGSVTLQERWFGFSESPVAPGAFWSINEILNCGGWGMGFLSASQSLEIQYVDPDCTYLPGREVVTSFIMKNRSSGDIYPEDDLRLYLNASYDRAAARGGAADRVTVLSAVSAPVAIPGEEDTYVWFRWTVPEDVHGEIRLKADYSFGGAVVSSDTVLINESLFEEWETEQSHTPEPTYESRPAWFSLNEIGEQTQSKSWHTWFYDEEIGEFFRWDWEATLGGSAILTPDSRVKSSEYYPETHTWAMRSGYGIACDAQSAVTVTANGETADVYGRNTADAAVPAERGKILFPEFLWSGDFNCYESAEYIAAETGEGTRTARFCLPENPDARGNRVHFTPLWFPDGFAVYRMAIEWEACWTPAGTLRARTVSDGITIDGSLYDDWYYSRS